MDDRRFNEWVFGADMRHARDAAGAQVAFTRQERAILLALVRHPRKLVLKHELHLAMASASPETSERRVDFVVNRLRQKLGDDARAPRFIATQYGEGYAWVAEERGEDVSGSLLVIGPVHRGDIAGDLLVSLHRQLSLQSGPQHRIRIVPSLSPQGRDGTQFALEVSFHRTNNQLHGAFVLRGGDAKEIVAGRHVALADDSRDVVDSLSGWIRDAMWRHLALPSAQGMHGTTDLPAEVRLHEAARALSRSPEAWRESEAQLRRAFNERPGDSGLAILWALNLHAQLIHWPPAEAVRTLPRRQAITHEIETLVFDNLAGLENNPLLKLAAAKLLAFCDPGHMELADRLADEAFAASTAFAAAHATRGQMLMCKGEIEAALALYDDAIAMSSYGSEFHIFLLVLKCGALLAANDRRRLSETATEMFLAKPETRRMAIFFIPAEPEDIPVEIGERLATYRREELGAIVAFLYHTTARPFHRVEHRANIMRGLAWQARRLHGPEVLPPEVAALFVPARA